MQYFIINLLLFHDLLLLTPQGLDLFVSFVCKINLSYYLNCRKDSKVVLALFILLYIFTNVPYYFYEVLVLYFWDSRICSF
jgi:hypothetical protein